MFVLLEGAALGYKTEQVEGITELLRFRRDPLAYIAGIGRDSVDVRHIRIGKRNLFLVNHPELIQNVLVTHDWNFIKGRGLRASKPMLGEGLLTSEGELHRRQRRLVQPAFHSSRMMEYAGTMVQSTKEMCDRWEGGIYIDLHREMAMLTLSIVGKSLFGADVLDDAPEIGRSLTKALRLFVKLNSPLTQLIKPVRRWYEQRAVDSRRRIERVLRELIADHRQHPERYQDMLSMLMAAHDEMGATYMSEELLLDECLTLFLAGHETTASALTWSWYLISEHPAAEKLLHEEIGSVLGVRSPSLEDIPHLQYTASVFREALRLFPPAWLITREAVSPYMLGEMNVSPGSTILMSPYATHQDSRFWEAPAEFRPERWLGDQSNGRPKFAFFPFGAGTRICIGEHFAMMEGVLALAAVSQRFRIQLLPVQDVELWPQITLRPKHALSAMLVPKKS